MPAFSRFPLWTIGGMPGSSAARGFVLGLGFVLFEAGRGAGSEATQWRDQLVEVYMADSIARFLIQRRNQQAVRNVVDQNPVTLGMAQPRPMLDQMQSPLPAAKIPAPEKLEDLGTSPLPLPLSGLASQAYQQADPYEALAARNPVVTREQIREIPEVSYFKHLLVGCIPLALIHSPSTSLTWTRLSSSQFRPLFYGSTTVRWLMFMGMAVGSSSLESGRNVISFASQHAGEDSLLGRYSDSLLGNTTSPLSEDDFMGDNFARLNTSLRDRAAQAREYLKRSQTNNPAEHTEAVKAFMTATSWAAA